MSMPQNTEKLLKTATLLSVSAACLLVAVKFAGWFMTDSVALLSSFVDSLLDVLSSLINFFAIRYALKPADENHRFGHGKAEDIASLAQSAFIFGSALLIATEGIKRLVLPEEVHSGGIGLGIMAFSMVVTALLVTYQRHVVKKTGSGVITSDSLHYTTDILSNLVVMIGIALASFGGVKFLDPLLGLAVAAYISHGAWEIGFKAFHNLMDREFDEELRDEITKIARSHPEARDVHHLRTRTSGIKPFIQFHLKLDGGISLNRAHEIAHEIEDRLLTRFPEAEIFIHQEPEG